MPKPRPRRSPVAERPGGLVLALLLWLGYFAPALAQSSMQQTLPGRIAPGNFNFYVLSLSWSPGFCATAGSDRAMAQCAAGADLGFVVHGLWPQFEHGFPADCDGTRNPSRIALGQAAGLYPDEGLARYEWRKHGTCTGAAPADYFADVRRAREKIVIPALFQPPAAVEQTITPADVARSFMAANPRLRPGMMAIDCQKTVLQEVRFCLTKDLRDFRTCPEVVRASCRAPKISVPPMH